MSDELADRLFRGWRYRVVIGVTALVLLGVGLQALWSARDTEEDSQIESRRAYDLELSAREFDELLEECGEAFEDCALTVVAEDE